MGRAKQKDRDAQRPDETYFQWRSRLLRQRQEQRDKDEPIIPAEALKHGDYQTALVLDPSGDTRNAARTLINRGGDPVARWEAKGKLSDNQLVAIAHCQRLWRLAGHASRITANYGERIPGQGSSERACLNEIEARQDLERLSTRFKRYWDVFENVCRHGHSAGTAGEVSGLIHGRSAMDRAHTIVCMVADMVFDEERL